MRACARWKNQMTATRPMARRGSAVVLAGRLEKQAHNGFARFGLLNQAVRGGNNPRYETGRPIYLPPRAAEQAGIRAADCRAG
jgi:hypothetical protein